MCREVADDVGKEIRDGLLLERVDEEVQEDETVGQHKCRSRADEISGICLFDSRLTPGIEQVFCPIYVILPGCVGSVLSRAVVDAVAKERFVGRCDVVLHREYEEDVGNQVKKCDPTC